MMPDDRFDQLMESSLRQRVRNHDPQPDLHRLDERATRRVHKQRGAWAGALVATLALGLLGGWIWSTHISSPSRSDIAVEVGDASNSEPPNAIEPTDPSTAREAISAAFETVFGGSVRRNQQIAAMQQGTRMAGLMSQAARTAELEGVTREQLAGTRVAVGTVTFIDPTHAVVPFTITVPEHSTTNNTGYAVVDSGRWKVALRTACDVLMAGRANDVCSP
jgi:hypothetical protein